MEVINTNMKRSKQFLINTMILTSSTLIVQMIAVFFSAYLGRVIGSAGIGLYQLVLSVYAFAVTFATSGIKLSTTRLVVEAMTNNTSKKSVVKRCVGYALCFGVVAFLVLLIFGDNISITFLHDKRTALSLKVLAFSLPFLAVSSAFCGYFTAVRKINRFAFTQIAEQLVRMFVTISIITLILPKDLEYACCSVAIGAVISEFISFATLFVLYLKDVKSEKVSTQKRPILLKLLQIAVPDAVSAYARSALLTIEHLLIPIGLQKYGMTKNNALSSYGLVHGMTLPIILFPNALCVALSNLLIPEIAEYYEKKDNKKIDIVVTKAIRMTFLFAVFVAGVLFAFSDSIALAIYNDSQVGYFIKVLAPLIPIMYTDTAVDGVLKGMGQQVSSMRYNIIDATISVVAVYILIPKIAIQGYIATIFIAEIINFILSVNKLVSITKFHFDIVKNIICPIFSVLVGISVSKVVLNVLMLSTVNVVLYSVVGMLLSLVIYIIVLRVFLCKEIAKEVKGFVCA